MLKGQIAYTTNRPTPFTPPLGFNNNSPYKGVALAIPGKIEAENYDNGGQGFAYNDNDIANTGGIFRGSEGVDVESCGEGTYDVAAVNAGEWIKYTVNVTQAGSYILQANVASVATGKSFYVELDGVNISGNIAVPNTGGVQTYQSVQVVTPALSTGQKVLRIVMNTDGFKINYLNLQLNTVPVITNLDTLVGFYSLPFKKGILATNNPTTYGATGLPAGLSINSLTGLITGKVTVTGTFSIVLSATNLTGKATKTVTLIIKAKLKIGPFGDSITQSNNEHNSYRYPLWQKLIDANVPFSYVGSNTTNFSGNPVRANYKGIVFDSINEGHWGITTGGFVGNFPTWIAGYTPDLVLLHLGTNDINNYPLSTSQANLTYIINKTREKNPDVVFIIARLIPRSGITPTAYNDMVAALAISLNRDRSPIILVDQATGFDTNTDTFDGTHPNSFGEEKMARRWFEAIVNYFELALPTPIITSASTVSGNVGAKINYTITASNTPTTFSGTGFPTGLSVNTLTGELQGWSAVSGTFNATINAINSGGTGSAPLTITIAPYAGSNYGTAKKIPGKVEVEDFDNGGEGIAYHDDEVTNYGGQYRLNDGVDVGTCPEGVYNIGFIGAGEWMNYKVTVDTAGVYILGARVATPNTNLTFHVELDGENISGPISFTSTGDWNAYQTVNVTTPKLTVGQKILRIVFDGGGFNLNYLNFTLSKAAPIISSAATANGVTGNIFSYSVTASNTPTSYSATGLPSGITINALTGLISGTTFISGTYNATMSATNAGGTTTNNLTITIVSSTPYGGTARNIPGKIEVEDFDNGGEGVAYHDGETNNYGGQYRLNEGVDIGTCTEGGYNIGFIGGGEWMNYSVNVVTAGSYVLSARVASPNNGLSFHVEMDGVNISGPIAFSSTGDWNTWATVNATTPALTTGQKLLRIVFDGGGFNLNYLSFALNQAAPAVSSTATANGVVGSLFSYTITGTNTPASYGATNLPQGLTVNTYTGIISGTPSTAGNYYVTLSATNVGGTGTKTLVLTVDTASVITTVVTEINEELNKISVYPNPVVNKQLTIAFDKQGIYTVNLYNYLGQIIYSTALNLQGETITQLSLPQNISSGYYQLEVIGGEARLSIQRIFVQE
jgi:lysophospholipase L1-like esterase